MKITARQIAEWSKTVEARGALPRLIRRLVHSAGMHVKASFPAGESTDLPGWDGELATKRGTPWIPRGKSFWEFSCNNRPTDKANRDFKKRTEKTPEALAASARSFLSGEAPTR